MSAFNLLVAQQVIDLMKDASDFDSIQVFIRGIWPSWPAPANLFPMAEVFVDKCAEGSIQTTGVHWYSYSGFVEFSVQQISHPEVSDRVATVDSYDTVSTLAQDLKNLLQNNQSLDNLTGDEGYNEAVWRVDIALPLYATSPSRASPDNLENKAQVGFTVYTSRERET